MVDIVSSTKRSQMMSCIRGKNTKPELLIRARLHKAGFRFRLHYGELPGKPDIVFPKFKAIVLVNGCFWHGHGCNLFRWPSTREEFWRKKIQGNCVRDRRNRASYCTSGWRTLTVWECALKGSARVDLEIIIDRICEWLAKGKADVEIAGRH